MQAAGGRDDLAVAEDRGTWAAFDTQLTPELEREGLMRDALRYLQQLRKDAGLEIEDRIRLRWATESDALADAIETFQTSLAEELLAEEMSRVPQIEDGETLKVDSHELDVAIQRVEPS